MNEKRNTNNVHCLRDSVKSFMLCALALIVVVLINWGVSSLPAANIKPDVSTEGLLNISEETKAVVSSVKEKVTVYHVAQAGTSDISLTELLARYADLNPNLTIVSVDPTLQPNFVSQYTTESLNNNSLIVVSNRRAKIIDYSKIYVTSYDNLTDEDYYNYYYYGIMPQGAPYFCCETELTSAIDYVCMGILPTVYLINNHEEDALSSAMITYLTETGFVTSDLTIVGGSGIPGDCTAIILNNPKTDLTVFEAQTLTNYLKDGGSVLLITDYRYFSEDSMPNLSSVTELMGMKSADGLVLEGDATRYNTSPSYLLPTAGTAGPGASLPESVQALICNAHGIVLNDSGAAQATILLSTSSSSYLEKDWENTTGFDEGEDMAGPLSVAASSTLNGSGQFVWFASPSIVSDQWDYYAGGANSAIFLTTLTWMGETVGSVSVQPKPIEIHPLTVTQGAANFWSVLITVCIPLAFIGFGFFIWIRRRRR